MHRWGRAVLAAGVVVTFWAVVHAQEKPVDPATSAQAATRDRIDWVASYDLAVKRMGADQAPVILYFTYDG